MRILLLLVSFVFSCNSSAAAIKYYVKEKESEVKFIVLSPNTIRTVIYDEEDKELSVVLYTEKMTFHVETLEEANSITSKIFDNTDNSIITLKPN